MSRRKHTGDSEWEKDEDGVRVDSSGLEDWVEFSGLREPTPLPGCWSIKGSMLQFARSVKYRVRRSGGRAERSTQLSGPGGVSGGV